MNFEPDLFTAHKFKKCHQGCVWGNGLPIAHDTLRVNDFAGQHGATVHGKLQNVHHFFAAIHFHVRAGRHIKRTALRFLRRSVIEQTPERSDGAVSFDGTVIDVNNARIGGGHFLPFCVSSQRHCQHHQQGGKRNTPLQRHWRTHTHVHVHAHMHSAKESALSGRTFHSVFNNVHARYYKVAQTS